MCGPVEINNDYHNIIIMIITAIVVETVGHSSVLL